MKRLSCFSSERRNMITVGLKALTVTEMIEAAQPLLLEENDRIEKVESLVEDPLIKFNETGRP